MDINTQPINTESISLKSHFNILLALFYLTDTKNTIYLYV